MNKIIDYKYYRQWTLTYQYNPNYVLRVDDSNVRQNTTINQEYNKYIGGDGGGGGGVK